MAELKRRVTNLVIALNQLAGVVLTLGSSSPDETISSHAHRLYVRKRPFGFLRHVINACFFWQDDHCLAAYEAEVARRHAARALG